MVDQREAPAGSYPVEGPELHRGQPSTEYLSADQKVIHPYSQKKGLDPDFLASIGCFVEPAIIPCFDDDGNRMGPWKGSALYRPVFDKAGIACGHERILSERISRNPGEKPNDKFAAKGSKVSGTFTPIGFEVSELGSMKGRMIVCAGLADGCRLYESTGLPVACGIGENNIPGIVAAVQEAAPDLRVIAAVDNDKAGKMAGEKAGCAWTCPQSAKDWSDVHQNADSETVLAEFQEGMRAPEPPEGQPRPLPDDMPPVMAFDPDNLPAALRDYVCDVADRQQCPPDYVAVAALVAISGVLGNKRKIRPKQNDDWAITPNLWGAMIGGPSAMKSPAMKAALSPVYAIERENQEVFEAELAEYKTEAELAEIQGKAAKEKAKHEVKKGNQNAAMDALRASIQEPEKPTRPRIIVNDSTVAKLGELLNENPSGLLLVRDEIAGWLAQMRGEDGQADRAFYLECFDGCGQYVFDRIGRGTLLITSTTLAIIGGIQPSKIAPLIRGAVRGSDDDGLIQRFQLAVFPDRIKAWHWSDRPPNKQAYSTYAQAFRKFSEMEVDETPRQFSLGAQEMFIEWMKEIQTRARSGELHPVMESHLMKMPKTVAALALIFELVDGTGDQVGELATGKALDFADYLQSHAERLYSVATHGAVTGARLLIDRRDKLSDPFTLREVQRKAWAGLTEKAQIRDTLDLLLDYGHLREIECLPSVAGGRPSIQYRWIREG
ncbi:DUF3987 domain-containing protein [Marinobacter alexandrii]|jgi:hypothetical protein|uniref:DUF3987 domain-containing protein n=1 Tax=Marinobacter alexandrii TaxID=2570351 RepID=UPI002ABE86E9|nr:DUF3987 domain-containing protein [Marinobacter alexandrii]